MPRVSVHGVDVFYRDEGQGEPVVLAHSSTASSGQWRELVSQLSTRYRVLAPDHLGYGRTGPYRGHLPLMDHEVAVIEALLRLAESPAHFIGHSFGGSVLVRAAARMPDRVRSLALVEPILFYLLQGDEKLDEYNEIKAVADRVVRYVDAGDAEEAARGFINYWVGPLGYENMREDLRASIAKGMAKVRQEWKSAFEPCGATIDKLAEFVFPILLVSGAKTTPPSAAVTGLLRQIWPTAKYAQIEGAGHMSPVSHAGVVNPIIREFVGGQIEITTGNLERSTDIAPESKD